MKARYWTLVSIVMIIILAATAAIAQGGPGRQSGNGGPGQDGQRREGPRPIFGEIIAMDSVSWTIRPMIPEFMEERMEEHGRELPELPDEITVKVTDRTWFTYQGEDSDAKLFSIGDKVVVIPRGDRNGLTAMHVADVDSAKQFIGQRMGEVRDRRDERGGGPDKGPRPAFGVITAISGDSITITPEVPSFIEERMQERGVEREFDLPDSLTFTIGDRTHFVVNGEPVDVMPFVVGDHVAVMGGRNGERPAMAVADYASAEQRIEEGPGMRGPGGPGGPGGQGGPDGQGSPPGQGHGGQGQKRMRNR